jgi:esterase/lipase
MFNLQEIKPRHFVLFGISALIAIYLVGPSPDAFEFDSRLPVTAPISEIEHFVANRESQLPVKPNNEAEIQWANDSSHQQTEYALVYLHGFSASKEEGAPAHRNIAREFGMNAYLARLQDHGLIADEPMLNVTSAGLMRSAQDALAIGSVLGKKVILMSTSTGGTLSAYLASKYPDLVAAQILYSPNIAIFDPLAQFANNPWGLQIARMVQGSDYNEWETNPERIPYWDTKYRLEAITELQEMMESTMTDATFQGIKQPIFMGYYYRDDVHQDSVVSVAAMQHFYEQIATPEELKVSVAYPNANNHVIASKYVSDHWKKVEEDTKAFLQDKLLLSPVGK